MSRTYVALLTKRRFVFRLLFATVGLVAVALCLSVVSGCAFFIQNPECVDVRCLGSERNYLPPGDVAPSELAGVWHACYSGDDVDTLTIRQDGTFQQVHEEREYDPSSKRIVLLQRFETTWNTWRLERFEDGRVWLHLPGARYYVEGLKAAEEIATGQPSMVHPNDAFLPPEQRRNIQMVDELIVSVRRSRGGELYLVHMPPMREAYTLYCFRKLR
jgi:hypothetical protein